MSGAISHNFKNKSGGPQHNRSCARDQMDGEREKGVVATEMLKTPPKLRKNKKN